MRRGTATWDRQQYFRTYSNCLVAPAVSDQVELNTTAAELYITSTESSPFILPARMTLAYPPPYTTHRSPLGGLTAGYAQPSVDDGQFAIARLNGAIRLVQVSLATPASALTTVDVKIFRHEFIHIFRYLECKTFHPADVHIIELIDDQHKTYEEERRYGVSREGCHGADKQTDESRTHGTRTTIFTNETEIRGRLYFSGLVFACICIFNHQLNP
ncbi:hypothetical protein MVEN_01379300 [Mycena venus]|uniref:Uncharacterized protein n=1 Tax=Mycena venus TaxID=2733690 RepID=A0A8H6XXM1_9AGAR|nr:hypothetical protein MVEN_01379300 [Mycena venus]